MEPPSMENRRGTQPLDVRKKLDGRKAMEIANLQGDGSISRQTKCDLRKSLAWDSAFFTSPGVLDPEELFATVNIHTAVAPIRSNDCNSRRSLAWDSAFFTSPGVLEPDELCLVNRGFKKGEINERKELWKSVDSDSASSLASLETELFEDLKWCLAKTTQEARGSHKDGKSGRGMRNIHSSKALDACAGRKSKTLPPPSRKPQICKASHEKTKNQTSRTLTSQSMTVLQYGESSPFPRSRPPKALRKAEPLLATPAKRASTAVSRHAKTENPGSQSAYEQGNKLKRPCLRESSCTPVGKLQSTASSFDFSASNSFRRKPDSRLTASDSAFKTPSRYTSGRIEPWISSARSQSPFSAPSYLADAWPSDPKISLNKNTSRLSSNTGKNHGNTERSQSEERTNPHRVEQESRQTLAKTPSGSPNFLKDTKPSALRVPSPTIGFFDTEDPTKQGCREPRPGSGARRILSASPRVLKPGLRTLSADRKVGESESVSKNSQKLNVGRKKPHTKMGKGVNNLQMREDKENIDWLNVDELSRKIGAVDLDGYPAH